MPEFVLQDPHNGKLVPAKKGAWMTERLEEAAIFPTREDAAKAVPASQKVRAVSIEEAMRWPSE